jgi:hypothetical protein
MGVELQRQKTKRSGRNENSRTFRWVYNLEKLKHMRNLRLIMWLRRILHVRREERIMQVKWGKTYDERYHGFMNLRR